MGGVQDTIHPLLVDAWIMQRLKGSPLLLSIHNDRPRPRFYEADAVPAPDDTPPRKYPYIKWWGGKVDVTQFYARESEKWGRIVSRYTVAEVRRFDSLPEQNDFTPSYQEFLKVLVGIKEQNVVLGGGQKIGVIYASRYKADHRIGYKDGDSRILEMGIVIDVMHK